MMKKRLLVLVALLAMAIFSIGCSGGSDGAAGAKGEAGTVDYSQVSDIVSDQVDTAVEDATKLAALGAESCAVCHKDAGSEHQAVYENAWQDAKITVTDITYAYAAGTTTVTFKMTKNGLPFSVKDADNSAIYWAEYVGTGFEMAGGARQTLKGTLTYDSATNVSTSTYNTVDTGDLSLKNGIIAVYGRDEDLSTTNIGASRVRMTKYPFAGVKILGAVGYTSAANVAGCEKCHTIPYFKHGYIYGEAGAKGAGKDFYTCKVCHLDNGAGGHYEWQLLVDDPVFAAEYLATAEAQGDAAAVALLSDAQKALYAYKTNLKNDVHMSHAMEFPYPQSMSNCVVCHENKINTILADTKFTAETCKSCHPVTGPEEEYIDEKRAPALTTIWADANVAWHDIGMTCNTSGCHAAGGNGKVFSAIHNGYDKRIYAAAGKKYSDIFSVAITSASIANNVLTIKFSATKTDPTSATSLAVTSITPTVVVGLYGWDTKDFIVDAHGTSFDDSGDGVICSRNCTGTPDSRNLEYVVGATHPRFTTVSAAGGSWEITANLAPWANLITDGTVKRVGIAVLPALKDADGNNVPVNSPSRTFDLTTNAFTDTFFSSIVKVTDGCNNCHDALGRTFHSAQYGTAGVVGCRFCHTPRSGGSHLEMQSRSIDSYVHAIHSFQPFDIGDIDFTDPVEEMHYGHHIEFLYPTFLTQNCESCHVAGKYEVPDQAKSLGGTLSAADTVAGRSIGAVPSYVTGPASRACGSCHRTMMINEDAAGELTSFNQHVKTFGYLIDGSDFDTVINIIMPLE